MFQSSSVFCVIVSVAAPHALPSVAMTVTVPVVSGAVLPRPTPAIVIMTPGRVAPPDTNDWVWRSACVGSERLHVAALPSPVTAGIWNVCAVLMGMYAEYIGEKTIGMVGLLHEPGVVLTPPPLSPLPVPPPSPVPVPWFPLELPPHASTKAATPSTPVASTKAI